MSDEGKGIYDKEALKEIAIALIPFGRLAAPFKDLIRSQLLKYFTISNGRVFLSGGREAMAAAMEFAEAKGMTTLEMTRAGKNLTKLTGGMPWSEAGPMWERLSAVYAKGAKGEIHVFQNSMGVRLESVWRRIEFPIVKLKNEIIFHNLP